MSGEIKYNFVDYTESRNTCQALFVVFVIFLLTYIIKCNIITIRKFGTHMTEKPTNHYVDNKKLYECIVEYKRKVKEAELNGKDKPSIPDYAGQAIYLIAENVTKRYHKFARYSYNDEMASDGIMNCIKYFDNFDETRFDNPHTYFTTICIQASIQRIKDEQKAQYVKYKSFVDEMVNPADPDVIFHENHGIITEEVYDNISEYIDDYERKQEENRIKRKQKLEEKRVMKDSLERFFVKDEDSEKSS